MSLTDFLLDPWKAEKSHSAYAKSALAVRPAPEFATSEVVVSSLYRAVGFDGFSEKSVIAAGNAFQKASQGNSAATIGGISNETWQTILHGILASPKQSNQSSKRFLQMSPLVPDANLYSGSARMAGNPWNPGALIGRMIQMGCNSEEEASHLWKTIFKSLSVDDGDDAWARWLQEEFARRKLPTTSATWSYCGWVPEPNDLSPADKEVLTFPAQQFCIDVKSIIEAKPTMTRRQWISLFEAIVRIGAVSHVLWLCGASTRIWDHCLALLAGSVEASFSVQETRRAVFSSAAHHLTYGTVVLPAIRNIASAYLSARLGLNVLLWHLAELGVEISSLNSSEDIHALFLLVQSHREELVTSGVLKNFQELREDPDHARTLSCKKGIGSNLLEFSRYSLGRRQTAEPTLRSYDQSYFLNKRGTAKSAPWIVSLGPVALLALVHCCLRQYRGPRSVKHLSKHLGLYGITVSVEDIGNSELGKELRMLGLILDSPDAESGILLVPPFNLEEVVAAR
jgi:hypothetical protein